MRGAQPADCDTASAGDPGLRVPENTNAVGTVSATGSDRGGSANGYDAQAENAAGSQTRCPWTRCAPDPDAADTAAAYSITAGNDDDEFAIDATTGVRACTGAGENHEGFTAAAAAANAFILKRPRETGRA